jgi:hypothetical protein
MIDIYGSEMEMRARVLVGLDKPSTPAEAAPLTDAERDYMVHDAYNLSPSFPEDEAPTCDDNALCHWWLAALHEYVDE